MPQKNKGGRPAENGRKDKNDASTREDWLESPPKQEGKANLRSDLHEHLQQLSDAGIDQGADGKISPLRDLCDLFLNEYRLGYELDNNQTLFPAGRASLCGFLDIGASTLSVWLKSGNIPRAAKVAIVLLYLREELREKLRELRDEISDIVVKNGDSYQLARLRENKDGTREWEVVVDGVKTAAAARELKSALNLQNAASQHSKALESAEHYLGNCGGVCSDREPFEKMADAIWAVRSQLKGEAQ